MVFAWIQGKKNDWDSRTVMFPTISDIDKIGFARGGTDYGRFCIGIYNAIVETVCAVPVPGKLLRIIRNIVFGSTQV